MAVDAALTPGCASWAKLLCDTIIHRHGHQALVLATATDLTLHLHVALPHTMHTIDMGPLVDFAQTACQCRSLSVNKSSAFRALLLMAEARFYSLEPSETSCTSTLASYRQHYVELANWTFDKCSTNQGQAATSGSQTWMSCNAARNSGVLCRAWLLPGDPTPK